MRRRAYGLFLLVHTIVLYFMYEPLVWLAAWLSGLTSRSSIDAGIVLGLICMLAFLAPIISLVVRRLHDRNTTGLALIFPGMLFPLPFVIVIGFLRRAPAEGGDNRYGPDPRAPDIARISELFE